MKNRILLFLTCIGFIVAIPYITWVLKNGFDFPEQFFSYPPINTDTLTPALPTNLEKEIIHYEFYLFLLIMVFTLFFYLFPKFLGFKKVASEAKVYGLHKFPVWFWAGLLTWVTAFIIAVLDNEKYIDFPLISDWYALPVWLGFIFFLDGLCVKLHGWSLFLDYKKSMMIITISSLFGWLIFDYLNFFALSWIYPNGPDGIEISSTQFKIYALLGSSLFSVQAFEISNILKSFNGLYDRYKQGFRIKISTPGLYFIQFLLTILLAMSVIFPHALFWLIWICPPLFIATMLSLFNRLDPKLCHSPFVSIVYKGNWSFAVIFGLSFVIMGFFLEFWNFFLDKNLCFWKYPFVNFGGWPYIFEMQLLGYLGYIPYSINCWIWYKLITYCFFPDNNKIGLMGLPNEEEDPLLQ